MKEIDVVQFNTIKEVYTCIEEKALELERDWDVSILFRKYSQMTKVPEEIQKAKWEQEFFLFGFSRGKIFSLSYSSDNKAPVAKYPDINKFQTKAFEYLKQRMASSTNPLILARYNHLLWSGPKGIKNKSFAIAAIQNYIALIKRYLDLYKNDHQKENLFRAGMTFENLIALCDEVKECIGELKSLTHFLLFDVKELEYYSRCGIIDDMLKYPKIFKKDDFLNTLSIFEDELKKDRASADDWPQVNFYLKTAIEVAKKLNLNVKKWHNEIGLAYLRLAEKEVKQDRFFLKQSYLAEAIHAFTLSSNDDKKKQAEQEYTDLKPKVILPLHTIKFSEKDQKIFREFQEDVKRITSKLLKKPPFEAYSAIKSALFFPKYADVQKEAKNSNNFMDSVSTILFDKNKNIHKPDEEMKKVLDIYHQKMSLLVLPYLHFIIISGIKLGHLTPDNFLEYLIGKTWIGKPYFKISLGGKKIKINWIPLLAPSIVEFFNQVQAWGNSKYFHPSFVLCIDSLTLKMEGLLRNFCERLDIPVVIDRTDAIQEGYVHNVLDNETIKKYFNEDDLLFFKYLFSNNSPLNLRNSIAHSYYNINDYQPDKMLLLLAALLRIGKYDYPSKE